MQHGAGRGGNWLLGAEQLRWLHTAAGQRLQERCCVAEGLLLLRMSGAVLLSIPLRLHALSSSESCFWLVLCRYKSLKAFPGGTVVCKHVCITLKVTQAVQIINPPFCTDDCLFFFFLHFAVEEVLWFLKTEKLCIYELLGSLSSWSAVECVMYPACGKRIRDADVHGI